MLQVVVGLKQCISSEELDQNAPNTPNITRERPPQAKNDLWGSVMPSRYNGRVVLVLEGSRPEINEPDFSVKQYFALSSLAVDSG